MRRLAAVALMLLAAPGSGAAATTPSQLLARHRPVLVLHPAEAFAPIHVEAFLEAAQLEERRPDGTWLVQPPRTPLPAAGVPQSRLNVRACLPQGLASVGCYAAAVRSPVAAYGWILRRARHTILQYWFLYAYNFWSAHDPPRDVLWRSHEGDWEMVSVVLSRRARPLFAAYSRHCGGARRAWSRVRRWRDTARPLVFVALGSHANYFAPGTYRHERRCYPAAALEVFRVNGAVPVDRAAPGREVRPPVTPVQAVLNPLADWLNYPGGWGETAYFHVPNVGPVGFGGGPAGPRFHTTWRRPETMFRWPLEAR